MAAYERVTLNRGGRNSRFDCMKKIHLTMKVLEWSQHFSHYKSMGIFPDAQGQVTHKSLVGSCWISKPSGILWVYLFPARMKKIQSKMKEPEWSQHSLLIFGRSRAANSGVSDKILPKFKLMRAFIIGLIICKTEKDPCKNEGTRVVTIISQWGFSRCSRAANS